MALRTGVTVAAIAATVAFSLTACAQPGPVAATSWEQRTVGMLLDLLHVTAPQPYLDAPDGPGDVAAMADAALIVRHANQTPDPASFTEFEKDGLFGESDPLGQSVLVHRALGTAPGSAGARATVARLGRLVNPGKGFTDPHQPATGQPDLVASVHALELLNLLIPADDQQGRRLRETARIPDVCSRLAAAGHADLLGAGVLLRLATLQHDTCPAGTLAQAVRDLPPDRAADPLDPSHIELLRSTVRGLSDLGALSDADREALGSPLAEAFRSRFGRSDTAVSGSGLQLARNALDALDALGIPVATPPSLVESARRMLRWHGSIADVDPNGQADRTVAALFALRQLAERTGGRDKFTQLLVGVRHALDASHLVASDAMIWRAALGEAALPAQSAADTDGMLAAVGAFSQHLAGADAACGADPAGLIDGEAPALSQDENLPAQAARVLRLAAATRLLLACGGRNRQSEVRVITDRAVQQETSTVDRSTATVSGLAMLAEAACLSGADPAPLRGLATTAISRQRLADGGAAASGATPDVQTTYDLLRLDTLSSGQCSAGWWAGLATFQAASH